MELNKVVKKDIETFVKSFQYSSDFKNKTFLITGSTGLIGSVLVRCLLALDVNISIIALVRNIKKAKNMFDSNSIVFIEQDMMLPLANIDYNVDYIIHCANSTSSKFYVENPVENINTAYIGTNNLLSFCKNKSTVKGFVYLSSLETYGSIYDDEPVHEGRCGYIDSIDVRSSYSLGKRSVECLCHSYYKEYNIPVKIARLTQTIGAGVSVEDNRVFAQFAKSIINNQDIVLHTKGESAKPYCYTIDAINAILCLLINGQNGEAYNVANSDTYISIYDMANFLVNKFCSDSKVVVELNENMGYAPATKLNLDTTKLTDLGWNPKYDLFDIYTNLIDYYKSL